MPFRQTKCVDAETQNVVQKDTARNVRTWIPRRVSDAMATQFFPTIAHIAAPLYSVIDWKIKGFFLVGCVVGVVVGFVVGFVVRRANTEY